jgi:hypothetical protein
VVYTCFDVSRARARVHELSHTLQVLAVEAWVRAFKVDMVVVYTGGGLGVTYPFDACVNYAAYLSATAAHCPSPDHPTFRTIAAAYVDELTAASQRLHGSAPRFSLPPGALRPKVSPNQLQQPIELLTLVFSEVAW